MVTRVDEGSLTARFGLSQPLNNKRLLHIAMPVVGAVHRIKRRLQQRQN
jgi:hypothetical protein